MKKLIVVALVISFVIYKQTHPTFRHEISDGLVELVGMFDELSKSSGENNIIVAESFVDPDEMTDEIPREIEEKMDEEGLSRVHYSCGKQVCWVTLYVDKIFNFIGPSWYYSYRSDGVVEETIVPSLDEALDEQESYPYFFCERAEVENWFFCSSDDP